MVDNIDHIVLQTSSLKKAINFYRDILGLEIVESSKNRYYVKIGTKIINLHEENTIAVPKAKNFKIGAMDICFISKIPLSEIREKLEKYEIEIIKYDVARTGSKFPLKSLYFYDFDGNLIEISNEVR